MLALEGLRNAGPGEGGATNPWPQPLLCSNASMATFPRSGRR